MDQEKFNEIIIKASLGYITNILYVLLIFILGWYATTGVTNPEIALYIMIGGALTSMILSTFVIRYGNQNDEDISWNITRLAVVHVPAIIALFFAISHLFL